MKMSKRMLLITLSLLLFAAMLFSGCTKDTKEAEVSQDATKAPAVTAAEEEETSEMLEPVELKLLCPGPPQKDQQMVDEAISEYLKGKINASLEIEQIDWGAWDDRSNLTIASGETCDIIFTAPWCGYIVNSSKGAFLDLTDLLNEYAPDIMNSSYNWVVKAATTNGKIYAVPSYQMMAQTRGLFLRKDLVEKYGPQVGFEIKEVNKPEDIEPLFEVIKENEPDMMVFYGTAEKSLVFCLPWDRQSLTVTTAINCYDEDPVYYNVADTDIYRETIQVARRWFEKGYTNKDIATSQEDGSIFMKSGELFAFSREFQHNSEYEESRNLGVDVLVYPLIKPIIATNLVMGAMFALPVQTENPERAMMLLNLMHSDKTLQNLMVYGIEGVHYDLVGENTISVAQGIDPANHPYKNQMWEFGNQALLYDFDTDPPNGAQLLDNYIQSAVATPALGFTYDPSPMKNEMAALANVAEEFDPLIATGVVDPEDGTYERYLQKLKDAGIDRVLEDQNSHLQEWMAENGG